ncbi:hypothetical protein CPAR01_11676 [Colletotrichum paranaense]|uniref:Uncharacterized protein n=1 Tax=Colletotrichum paranaense TaxID=1914294 RepID=A0ABQ9S7V0_9PEZI|nr:uncharacterized protein CPAR01_11676 [Colletotrichum paranaense]KAK1529364.1 hypothetical protein CPAR01_11676 [Colletotrichum paranaense]
MDTPTVSIDYFFRFSTFLTLLIPTFISTNTYLNVFNFNLYIYIYIFVTSFLL